MKRVQVNPEVWGSIASALSLIGTFVPGELIMRSVLMGGQLVWIFYGYKKKAKSLYIVNILMAVINIIWILILLYK